MNEDWASQYNIKVNCHHENHGSELYFVQFDYSPHQGQAGADDFFEHSATILVVIVHANVTRCCHVFCFQC